MSNTGSPCISDLWANAGQATITNISLHTFISRLSMPALIFNGRYRKVCDIFDTWPIYVAHRPWPRPLNRRLGRTVVISSMASFCSSEAVGVSSQSLVSQIQRMMALSLRRRRCSSGYFGPQVSLLQYSLRCWFNHVDVSPSEKP